MRKQIYFKPLDILFIFLYYFLSWFLSLNAVLLLLTLWHSDQLCHVPHPWGDEAVLETQVPWTEKDVIMIHRHTKALEEKKKTPTSEIHEIVFEPKQNKTKQKLEDTLKITTLWEGNHLQLCLWINICVNMCANWIHN